MANLQFVKLQRQPNSANLTRHSHLITPVYNKRARLSNNAALASEEGTERTFRKPNLLCFLWNLCDEEEEEE